MEQTFHQELNDRINQIIEDYISYAKSSRFRLTDATLALLDRIIRITQAGVWNFDMKGRTNQITEDALILLEAWGFIEVVSRYDTSVVYRLIEKSQWKSS